MGTSSSGRTTATAGPGSGRVTGPRPAPSCSRTSTLQTPEYSFPEALTVVGNRLFFTADDGINGRQLWATDGTAAGTGMVKDRQPAGRAIPQYKSLHADGRRRRALLFAADDGTHGTGAVAERRTTAGTTRSRTSTRVNGRRHHVHRFPGLHGRRREALLRGQRRDPRQPALAERRDESKGTTPVSNLSFPDFNPTQAIANVNGSLFFQADDGIHGEELWMIPAKQLAGHGRHADGGHAHEGGGHGPRDGAPAAGFLAMVKRT